MEPTLIIGMIFFTLCILFWVVSRASVKKEIVIEVKAGPIDSCSVLSQHEEKNKIVHLFDGSYVNTRNFIRIKIHGNCMNPRNILDGEEWLVEPLKKRKDIQSQIKPNDIILLYVQDKNIYKIREVKEVQSNEKILTFYYSEQGEEKESSKPHRSEQVKGIVRYAI